MLYDWHPRYLYENLIDSLDWFLGNVVTHAWHQHDVGLLPGGG